MFIHTKTRNKIVTYRFVVDSRIRNWTWSWLHLHVSSCPFLFSSVRWSVGLWFIVAGSPILSQGKWGEYAQRDHEKKPPRRLRYIACMPVETRSNTPGQVVLRFSTSSIQCLYKIPYTRGSIANPWRKTMQQSNTSVTSADISVCPRAVH